MFMYSHNIDHIFVSAMPNSHLFNHTKDNPQDHVNNFDNTEKKPSTFKFQNHSHETLPYSSQSFDSVILESSLKLKDLSQNPNHSKIKPRKKSRPSMNFGSPSPNSNYSSSNPSQNQINQINDSSSHSCSYSHSHFQTRNDGKKEELEGGGGEDYEVDGPLHLLLSDDNYKLKVEEEEQKKKEDDDDDDDDDGFKTPTSLDQRIPEAKQCPHAPKKPNPSLKRKALHSTHHIITSLDLSTELELLFPSQHNPLSCSHQRNKKVRRDQDLK